MLVSPGSLRSPTGAVPGGSSCQPGAAAKRRVHVVKWGERLSWAAVLSCLAVNCRKDVAPLPWLWSAQGCSLVISPHRGVLAGGHPLLLT